jgi:hypothetical protein
LQLGVRFYDSKTGKFSQQDPVKDGLNWNEYVVGRPVSLTDPNGLSPKYDPQPWNYNTWFNNCYSYAINQLETGPYGPYKRQPGATSGATCQTYQQAGSLKKWCDNIRHAARADGLRDADIKKVCPAGWHKVMLFTGKNVHDPSNPTVGLGPDYHWYRRDGGGNWSNKHGVGGCVESLGKVHPNAVKAAAARWGYTEFCGYMCAKD